MGFKIWYQVGGEGALFLEITLCAWVLKYLVPNFSLFFLNWVNPFSWKSQKHFLPWKIEKVWFQTCHFFVVFYWIHMFFFLIQKSATRGCDPNFFNLGFSLKSCCARTARL